MLLDVDRQIMDKPQIDKYALSALGSEVEILSDRQRAQVLNNFRSRLGSATRKEMTFAGVEDALNYIEINCEFGSDSFILGYDLERSSCLIADTDHIINALKLFNTMMSLDGFVLVRQDFQGAVIADYEDVLGARSSGEVYLSTLGSLCA